MDAAGLRFGFKCFEIAPRVLDFALVAFAFPGSSIEFRRSAMVAATLGSAMSHEVAQGLRNLLLGPIRMLRAQGGGFQLAHLFHEGEADFQSLGGRHPSQRLDLLRV